MPIQENLWALLQETAKQYPLKALKTAAENLSLRYRTAERTGEALVLDETDAAAYAASRMPATFAACNAVFRELKNRAPEMQFDALLDVGAGTGAATLAALERFPFKTVTCLERARAMAKIGERLTANASENAPDIHWISADFTRLPENTPRADVVVAAYAMNELSDTARAPVLKRLFDLSNKVLVLVESGTPSQHCLLRAAAEELVRLGGFVFAPCPAVRDCPLPADDWCHFTVRVQRSRLHRLLKGGDAPFEDEKFSYLLVSKEPIEPVSGRVLRHPTVNPGRIDLKLCTKEGILLKTCTRSQKAAFKAARKLGAGDGIQLEN